MLELDRSDLDPRFLADADCRWLNRGGYDLMGTDFPCHASKVLDIGIIIGAPLFLPDLLLF